MSLSWRVPIHPDHMADFAPPPPVYGSCAARATYAPDGEVTAIEVTQADPLILISTALLDQADHDLTHLVLVIGGTTRYRISANPDPYTPGTVVGTLLADGEW